MSRPKPLVIGVVLAVLAALPGGSAAASSPYALEPIADASVTAGAMVLGFGLILFASIDDFETPPCGDCDASTINALDRAIVDNHDETWGAVSDVLLSSLVAAPFAVDLLDVGISGAPISGYGTDSVVHVEALFITLALTSIAKVAVGRARPFTYREFYPLESRLRYDAGLSFFSGHTSMSFTGATATAMTFSLRHPDDPARFAVWGVMLGLASLTGYGRIAAGKHFWTDVLTGAAVGSLVGILVPLLHRRQPASNAQATRALSEGRAPRVQMLRFGASF